MRIVGSTKSSRTGRRPNIIVTLGDKGWVRNLRRATTLFVNVRQIVMTMPGSRTTHSHRRRLMVVHVL